MIGLLESGIDPYSRDISCELAEPCFVASALHTGVSENILCFQLHFEYCSSGPLVQGNSLAKLDLDITQSFDVVFSSDRSVYQLQSDRDSSFVGSCTIGYDWSDRFTGKPYSIATGLYYYYQRWYDPSIGRFVSADPRQGRLSNPQSLNLYIYVLDRPTSLIDLSGLDECNVWNPFSYGGCAKNYVVNQVTTITTGINVFVDRWNNDADFRTIVISIAVITVVVVATGGLGLAATPVIIGGLSGAGISGAFYAAGCGNTSSGCTPKGFAAAVLSGGALGALGGIAGPVAGAVSSKALSLTGATAALATRGITAGISATAQFGMDRAQGAGVRQTEVDTGIALVAGFLGAPSQVESPASFRWTAVDISQNFRLSDTRLAVGLGVLGAITDLWFEI